MSDLMTEIELAEYLGCAKATIRQSRWNGVLLGKRPPSHRKIGRLVRYERQEVERWADEIGVPLSKEPTAKPSATPSRREQIAEQAMSALLSWGGTEKASVRDYARWAVAQADALIAELERTGGQS